MMRVLKSKVNGTTECKYRYINKIVEKGIGGIASCIRKKRKSNSQTMRVIYVYSVPVGIGNFWHFARFPMRFLLQPKFPKQKVSSCIYENPKRYLNYLRYSTGNKAVLLWYRDLLDGPKADVPKHFLSRRSTTKDGSWKRARVLWSYELVKWQTKTVDRHET